MKASHPAPWIVTVVIALAATALWTVSAPICRKLGGARCWVPKPAHAR